MTNVCFTGRGVHPGSSKVIARERWELWARAMDWSVDARVTAWTHVLVASRADTVKAKQAIANGVRVITYDEFYRRYQAHIAGGDLGSQQDDQPCAAAPTPTIDEAVSSPLWGLM